MRRIRSRRFREIVESERLRRVDGAVGLDEGWVVASGAAVIAVETVGRIDDDQAPRFAAACRQAGIDVLIGVANDSVFGPVTLIPGIRVETTAQGLQRFDRFFIGGDAVLMHMNSSLTWLGTANDFAIVAGPADLLLTFEPRPSRALGEFREFATTQMDMLRPSALRALELFERYAPGEGQ